MTHREQQKYSLLADNRGMASILVTLVTMIVVTLIVLGFATISRREQGNTLDKQLSTQAFYAAESAVNDARNVIQNAVQIDQSVPSKKQCNANDAGGPTPYPVPTGTNSGVVLDDAHNVSYTCLLVNPAPTSLVKDGVEDNSWVVPVIPADSTQTFDTIEIQWSPDPAVTTSRPSTDCPVTPDKFGPAPPSADPNVWNCKYGVLRMDLVPTGGASLTGGSGGGSMLAQQLTAFFDPLGTGGGGTLQYPPNVGKANVVTANCNTGSYIRCRAWITRLPSNSYTLRLNSIYSASDITVIAHTGGPSGQAVPLSGQVLVDATGDANGVLRRIQVRFSAFVNNGLVPRYALQSNSAICKRFYVTPTYFANAGDVINPAPKNDPITGQPNPNYNAMCDNSLPSDGSP